MHSVHNSNTFIGHYNAIDKLLSSQLRTKGFISWSEKIQIIADGDYPISSFVKIKQNKLRYFGELRNQLVHGFSLEHKHYVVASDHAVEEIKRVMHEMQKPRTIGELFETEVFITTLDAPLIPVIHSMRNELNSHVPVYDAD